MRRTMRAAFLLTLIAPIGIVAARASAPSAFAWNLPPGFPAPPVPADNPMSGAKVSLGRYLFYDTRLSGNGTESCATCHQQARAFTDGRAQAIGSTGELHPRGSMSLVNIAYASALTWADPRVVRLEDQAKMPMFGHAPIELGLTPDGPWLDAIRRDPTYRPLFAEAFGAAPGRIDVDLVVKAIASFERSIVSARSPYDRYHDNHDDAAVSPAVRRGETLFHSRPLSCVRCHGGFLFAGDTTFAGRQPEPPEFHNTGLYNLKGLFSYPPDDTGLYAITHDPHDVGKFKAPTLRNIAVTAPYMHDGSVATLEDAVNSYAAGGRTIATGPYAGVGCGNPDKSPIVGGFTLTDGQRADLIAFLTSLTDEPLLHDPRFADPWPRASAPAHAARSTDVLVFAAASLTTALDALVAPAEQATGAHMRISYAASSALARQIESGAPAELFISADLDWMDYLAQRRLIRPDSRVNLLGNQLVLIAPKGAHVTLEIGPGFPLATALGHDRIALADPDAVPAGKYAKAALTSLGVWNAVAGKVAAAQDVRAALRLVSQGEAPFGIVYRTDAFADAGVAIVGTFPDATHPAIVYPAALTTTASAAAARILAFLKGGAARAVFEQQGFSIPQRH